MAGRIDLELEGDRLYLVTEDDAGNRDWHSLGHIRDAAYDIPRSLQHHYDRLLDIFEDGYPADTAEDYYHHVGLMRGF